MGKTFPVNELQTSRNMTSNSPDINKFQYREDSLLYQGAIIEQFPFQECTRQIITGAKIL